LTEAGADSVEARTDDGAPAEPGARREGDERRGRSRDRYGRERRERTPREGEEAAAGRSPEATELAPMAEAAAAPTAAATAAPEASPPSAPVAVVSVAAASEPVALVPSTPQAVPEAFEAPPARRAERAPRPTAMPAVSESRPIDDGRRALPKVQAFELPLADLAQVAEGSGLHWVNSDAERVAQVHAAIAAEAKPIHVPRERPAAAVTEEGPLVLVETRRDLAATVLPFERQPGDTAR